MAIVFQTVDTTGPGVRITLPDDDTGLVVAEGVLVGSTDSNAVVAEGQGHDVQVFGAIVGAGAGIAFVETFDTTGTVRVMEGGSVSGSVAISFNTSSNRVFNEGTISGGAYGILMDNSLEIGVSSIVNLGTIQADSAAIALRTSISTMIVNAGRIIADDDAISGGADNDTVVNLGLIVGDVHLGGDGDLFDNRSGVVVGTIYGDSLNDTFLPGAGVEVIDGGTDNDTIDFRGSAGLRVSLGDGTHTGLAEGDTYISIERVLGSRSGADTLRGDGHRNTLEGFGGNDLLAGGAGNDFIVGGVGADTLQGNTDNDIFRYNAASEGGDRIEDFVAADDAFSISTAGFEGGLQTGFPLSASQFQTRADNAAQDADDRFIFRTTDQTLWYDSNGSVAGGLTLIADLQTGATVTAADILLQ